MSLCSCMDGWLAEINWFFDVSYSFQAENKKVAQRVLHQRMRQMKVQHQNQLVRIYIYIYEIHEIHEIYEIYEIYEIENGHPYLQPDANKSEL